MGQQHLTDPQDWLEKHGDYLFRCAVLRVRDQTLAEEMVQETLVAALQARDRFAGQSSERSWFVGILKHKIGDRFRKASREGARSDVKLGEREFHELFDEAGHWKIQSTGPKEWTDPSHKRDRQEFWEVMKRCLEQLPPRMASAFVMREVDEVPSEEVCMMLNITKSNLGVMLHRARSHLRQCLEVEYMGLAGQEKC